MSLQESESVLAVSTVSTFTYRAEVLSILCSNGIIKYTARFLLTSYMAVRGSHVAQYLCG